jgi:hypothetical protein
MTLVKNVALRMALLGAALCSPAWSASITYNVLIDTSGFSNPIGALGFLLTDLDGVANSEAEISNFSGAEEGLFSLKVGDVEGSLHDGLRLGDGQWLPLSSYFEFAVVFNSVISYTLNWDTTSGADSFTAVLVDSPMIPLFTINPNGVQSAARIVRISSGPAIAVSEGMAAELPLLLLGLAFAFWQGRNWFRDGAAASR